MAAIQIGKYKRPGIFIEEYDLSQIANPTVIEGITNMVIGFSKKGPVNTPIRLTNVSDLEAIFGTIDRSLERKGSYFHRTVTKMLESSPVYALNLLKTDDTLDKIQFKSLSGSSYIFNAAESLDSYRKFFNTTGFWKRDTQAFLDQVSLDPIAEPLEPISGLNTLINLTNVSDRAITVFTFKSSMTGFDVQLQQWYGSADKVPTYLYPTDFASDYLVDVVVVAGDWTNYSTLSTDSKWSKYFDATGLLKGQVSSFIHDRNINLLGYYQGLSLIPYFKDLSGRNIFIETLINNDTDKTGLFCAFNVDRYETDYPNGMLDLIGNTLVGTTQSTIDFLSYNDTIIDSNTYDFTDLDRPGNTWAIIPSGYDSIFRGAGATGVAEGYRSALYSEGYVYGVYTDYSYATASYTVTGTVYVTDTPYVIIGGKKLTLVNNTGATLSTTSFTSSYTPVSGTNSFYSTLKVDNTGKVSMIGTGTASPAVNVTDVVFGYTVTTINPSTSSYTFVTNDVSVNDGGFNELVSGVDFNYQYLSNPVTNVNIDTALKLQLVFELASTDKASSLAASGSYEKLRRMVYYNSLTSFFTSESVWSTENKTIVTTSNVKLTKVTITGKLGVEITNLQDTDGVFLYYKTDDEFIIGSSISFGIAYSDYWNTSGAANATVGVFGQYSKFYMDYVNGIVQTDDYITGPSGNKYYINITEFGTNTGVYIFAFFDLPTYEGGVVLDIETYDPVDYAAIFNEFTVISRKSNFSQSLDVEYPDSWTPVSTKILVNAARYTEVKVGDYLEASYDPSTLGVNTIGGLTYSEVPKQLTRIIAKKAYASVYYELTCDAPIALTTYNYGGITAQTTRYASLDNYVSTYKGTALTGFKMRNESMPNGTETRQNDILNLVKSGTPLFKALTNKEAIDFRYLIDSFGLGLIEFSKQQLMDICGARLDCFGFLNMPSMKNFKHNTDPQFVNDGVFDTAYVAAGANQDLNPSTIYSFGTGAGTTCVGYFGPYLTVSDGRPLDLPPAMFVATTYMRKHNTNFTSIVPWTIAAGVTNGKVTGFNKVEMDFTPTDIENLNGAQMNPIVYKRNRGFVIETENTAQTEYKSALSYIHVREVLIELERELSRMLLDFQWKFNTPEVRSEIKLRADVICEQYVNKNGLYNYFNKCDSENNTSDLIDRQIGVLDTYVEPIKGMGIIVNNVTILRTGAIQSGGFA